MHAISTIPWNHMQTVQKLVYMRTSYLQSIEKYAIARATRGEPLF